MNSKSKPARLKAARPNLTQAPLVLRNLLHLADHQDQFQWLPFQPGVEIYWIYQIKHGPAAAFIRFQPGGRVPLHEHRGYEHIFVLSGSQTDETGHLETGALMVHSPGTRHSVSSAEGCLVLAIYEKPALFLNDPLPQD